MGLESFDYGETWSKAIEGLRHGYLVGIAVDFGNPDAELYQPLMALLGHFHLMMLKHTCTKRFLNNGNDWKMVSKGLPEPNGTTISILEPNQKVPGEIYARIIVESLSQLTQVNHGVNLLQNGQKNIFCKLFGRYLLLSRVKDDSIR